MKKLLRSLGGLGMLVFCGAVGILTLAFFSVAATPKPAPKPSPADQKILTKVFRVPCLDCNDNGSLKYRLKPVKVTSTGSRSAPNGFVHEMTLSFRCPVRHTFEVLGHEVFFPAIRAEEEK